MWKGKQHADGEWETEHSILGWTACVVVEQDLRCASRSSESLALAEMQYNTLRKLIEACLPSPEWIHSPKADPLPSERFIHPDGQNGFIALEKTQRLKLGTGDLQPVDIYGVKIVIFERF